MSNLQEFHHTEEAEGKGLKYTIGGVIVALLLGGAIYVWQSGMLTPPPQPKSPVSNSQLP